MVLVIQFKALLKQICRICSCFVQKLSNDSCKMVSDQTEIEEVPGPKLLASVDDLKAVDLATVLGDLERADEYALEKALEQAANEAAANGNSSAERGYRLLCILCTLHLRIDNAAAPWGPRWQSSEGRSYTASDFRGEQNSVLAKIVDGLTHPSLRARVADVVWYNDRKETSAAIAAIDAYCEVIERRLDGSYSSKVADLPNSILDLVDWFQRALQITTMLRKRGDLPGPIARVFEALYQRANATGQYVGFVRVAYLGLDHGLADWSKIAPDAENLAQHRVGGDYPMAVQAVWNLAAQGYARLNDEDSKRRCQERSVNETLKMREQVDSAMAQAYWTRKAIGELRAAGGFRDWINDLRVELHDLQDASLDEFAQFTVPLDVAQQSHGTVKIFDELTLPDALLQFGLLTISPKVGELRQQALDSRKTSILSSLMGKSYADREGKTVAETEAASFDGDPDDAWIKEQSLLFLDLRRQQIFGGAIEPARRAVMTRFPLEERHFTPIAQMSPFVPPGHEHLFALGFTRLWEGEAASAAYLLIPQLENSLRHVLRNSNRETSKIKPDLLQEDRSLSGLLEALRPELEEVFGSDIINEIDLLFNYRPGPALRHEMAHGKLSAGECYHPTAVYACWMIYHLTLLPLVRYWKDQVAPAIEQAAL